MELSDIKLKHPDTKRSDAAIYVNTIIGNGSVANTTILKSGDTGENDRYETLNFDTKKNEANRSQNASKSLHWEDIPNRIKYAVYAVIPVIAVLFVVDIVVVVLISLPKSKVDGNWIQWSPWSNCDVTCNNGTQTRMRFSINLASSNEGIDCPGKSVDTKQCENNGCSVDGNWIQWSPWSNCDFTCNNRTQTRMRFCINPAPSNGGIDCSGNSVDKKQCENDGCSAKCQWSPWGSCSVSCVIGMKRRDCSRPYPCRNRDKCYGESRDDRICMPDGGWSSWGSWGTCSDTCDGGVQSRLRTCTNPRPSLLGRYCDGSSEQVIPCNKHTCSDGGWSRWDRWGSCSDKCDGGVRNRLRTCTNPRPSLLGKFCDGSPEQVMACNKQACPDHKVAFTAYGSSKDTSDAVIKFPYTHLNIGEGYSSKTGRFTCKIPGIYNFAVTLTKINEDVDDIGAFLRVNGRNKLYLFSFPGDHNESFSLSVAGNFHLSEKDFVDVYGDPGYFYDGIVSSFTGVLVIPDE